MKIVRVSDRILRARPERSVAHATERYAGFPAVLAQIGYPRARGALGVPLGPGLRLEFSLDAIDRCTV